MTRVLLATMMLVATGCLNLDERYACHVHEDCADLLNRHCGGFARQDVATDTPCPQAEAYDPVADPLHGVCVYPYCTPKDEVVCGDGICTEGQTCVLSKDPSNSEIRLLCLDLSTSNLEDAPTCRAVARIGECADDVPCVLSLERRALGYADDQLRICVPDNKLSDPVR
jgi:hypothetical protein